MQMDKVTTGDLPGFSILKACTTFPQHNDKYNLKIHKTETANFFFFFFYNYPTQGKEAAVFNLTSG